MKIKLVAAVSAALLSSSAHAVEIFQFTFTGPAYTNYYPGCPIAVCGAPIPSDPWVGTVDVTTTSGVDGTYTGDSLLSLSLLSNRGGFTASGLPSYPISQAYVTISAGAVVSVDVTAGALSAPYYERFELSGLDAIYDFGGCPSCSPVHASAALIPAISEPPAAGLITGGLLLLLLKTRRRRPSPRLLE